MCNAPTIPLINTYCNRWARLNYLSLAEEESEARGDRIFSKNPSIIKPWKWNHNWVLLPVWWTFGYTAPSASPQFTEEFIILSRTFPPKYQQYHCIQKVLTNNTFAETIFSLFWRHKYCIFDWQVTVTMANHIKKLTCFIYKEKFLPILSSLLRS